MLLEQRVDYFLFVAVVVLFPQAGGHSICERLARS
jgi:hypothetical protein